MSEPKSLGHTSSRFKLRCALSLGLLIGLVVTACSEQPRASTCTAENYIEDSVETRISEQGEQLEVTVIIDLINATEPQTFRFLAFLDKEQVELDVKPFTLDCGESKATTFTVDAEDAHALNVFRTYNSLIPEALEGNTPQSLPDNFQWINFTSGNENPSTTTLSDNPPPFTPSQLPVTYLESRFAPSRASYIFLDDIDINEHVTTLAAGDNTAEFNLYFDSVIDSGPYSITCTLDDQQAAVFAEEEIWSGRIELGQAVVLPGAVTVEEPGWHQLRCFVLNNLYSIRAPDTYYDINSFFIYKEP